jgi:two-component system, sensor histidine kinase and response regulator
MKDIIEMVILMKLDKDINKKTEHQHNNQEKDIKKSFFQYANQVSDAGFWYLDVFKNELSWADETYELLGIPKSQPIDEQTFVQLIHPDDKDYVVKYWNNYKDIGKGYTITHRVIVNGHIKWLEAKSLVELNNQQEVVALFGTLKDVTERINEQIEAENYRLKLEDIIHEKALELEKSKLQSEKSSQIKSSFLSNMSHEIRTPMNAIIGYAHLLEQKITDPEQKEYIDRINDASKHLLGIINDILDLSKIEAGKMILEERPFKLDKLISEVRSIVIEMVKVKKLYIDIEKIDCPEVIIGDSNRIRQILINLLSNAVKFTDTGGISLVLYIENQIDDTHVNISFKVKDTGIGMTDEQQKRLFQEFEQADSSTTRLYGGTGLGLSISKKLSELMNGLLTVESKLNEGSEFILTIPVEIDELESTLNTIDLEDSLEIKPKIGSKILLAEDNFLSQKLAHRILTNMGMEVTVANNGKIAVDLAKSKSFDLVILDIQMPVMDGIEAAKQMRLFNKKTPILAMTANAFSEDKVLCLKAGMNDYISKPIDPKSLSRALSNWIPEDSK